MAPSSNGKRKYGENDENQRDKSRSASSTNLHASVWTPLLLLLSFVVILSIWIPMKYILFPIKMVENCFLIHYGHVLKDLPSSLVGF